MKRPCLALLLVASGCGLSLDPPARVIHARFDPDAKVIPMPTDILRDAAAGHLDIPIDDTLTPAEQTLYTAMNQLDGWSSAMSATVSFDGPIDPATITADNVQVWHWRQTPERVDGVRIEIADDEMSLTIDPPQTGWERGEKYMIVLRGGAAGLEGKAGEKVECDAAFYFLRQTERLDTPEHERAFPGNTAAERRDNAAKLEQIREDLAPFFDYVDGEEGLKRPDVAALWSFTVTQRTELAMDKASQRMPLPLDILKDPDTGHIDLPPAPWDSQTVLDAKARLRDLTGFGTSANPMFQFTGPVDPATVTDQTIEVWDVGAATPVRVPAQVTLLADQESVEVVPDAKPLTESTRYAIVVRDGIKAADGTQIVLMPLGVLLQARDPVASGDKSLVGPVPDDDARRLEKVRPDVVAAEDALAAAGQGQGIQAAWTFTTMPVTGPMATWLAQPEALGVPTEPTVTNHQTPTQALGEFALAISSLTQVSDVVSGTVPSPEFIDPATRALRVDGGHDVEGIQFTAIVPKNLKPTDKVPVVIFGHAILTERRMLLALGDALARKGFAAVAIDLPYHGSRTICWTHGPLSIPDPTTGKLTPIGNPCSQGGTCTDDGRCVASDGVTEVPLANWPVIPMPVASGEAFLEIENIANTRDHFLQAEIDLSALLRSLRQADWSPVFGAQVDTSNIMYAGQSLGGIIGGTFVATHPEISRAVLNVPGADSVDLFKDSPYFSTQINAFFKREGVDPDSFDGHRFLNVARWFMDGVDPESFATTLLHPPGKPPRGVLIQMATLDAIIPNAYTELLQDLSGAPRRDYVAEHAFLVIPVEPAYLPGTLDLASYLNGELDQ